MSHLHRKLRRAGLAEAAWGGLQDSVPRAGLTSLHARVEDVAADSWQDPSLVQIWFRGGADYIVPSMDRGIFTLGSYPRNSDDARELERLADRIERATKGEMSDPRTVERAIGRGRRVRLKRAAITGRVVIRWDASRLWIASAERPPIDEEDARRALARRFLHWFGPSNVSVLARWTGVNTADAKLTWAAIAGELAEVDVEGRHGWVLAEDVERLRGARPIEGVRLLPVDDPYTKFDHDLLVPDLGLRRRVLPRTGESPGYIPGAVLVNGDIVGAWQRQQRRVQIHPFVRLDRGVRELIESEAETLPIPGASAVSVTWTPR